MVNKYVFRIKICSLNIVFSLLVLGCVTWHNMNDLRFFMHIKFTFNRLNISSNSGTFLECKGDLFLLKPEKKNDSLT